MVLGFPGGTQRYLSSYGIELAQNSSNPARIKARTRVLDINKESMDAIDSVRIEYASRYSQISNYWKYYIGQNEGLKRMNTIAHKKEEEKAFHTWANATPERQEKYGHIMPTLDSLYTLLGQSDKYVQYINEAAFANRPLLLAYRANRLYELLSGDEATEEEIEETIESYKGQATGIFENYHRPTEQRLFAEGMKLFYNGVPKEQLAEGMKKLHHKYKGDWQKYAERAFKKSVFDSKEELMAFLENPSARKLKKDPVFEAYKLVMDPYFANVRPQRRAVQNRLDEVQRTYLEGLMKMYPGRNFYPDANSTLRLTYGTVKGYHPEDAVFYNYYTTMTGIMEKEDPEDNEFIVPEKLKALYKNKDFGRYGVDGEMRVNFITNNDITGGNSGSPVINGKGELIGIAFDGNWEAMTGDLVFDEEYKRCINVDIRYVLFIIEKYAGAGHLIEEMDLEL
jgi:hypothetical protein